MKKNIFILVTIIFFSVNYLRASADTEGGITTNCLSCDSRLNERPPEIQMPMAIEAAALKENLNKVMSCEKQSSDNCLLITWLKDKYLQYTPECREFFINPNGEIGDYSKWLSELILTDIEESGEASVFTKVPDDFLKYCPNFKNFSLIQKVAFHTWIFELTAFPESTCNVHVAPVRAATTTAVCMYQLESSPAIRKWRSNGFRKERCAVSAAEVKTMQGCTGCAFDEYKRKMLKDGTPFGVLNDNDKFVSRSYWASHNPLNQKQVDCMLANQGTHKKTGRPLYLTACRSLGAHNEWLARAKFFGRLPRFPLCKSIRAEEEIKKLNLPTPSRPQSGGAGAM